MEKHRMKITKKEHRKIADKYYMKVNEIINIITNYQNPYPPDIFVWENKEILDFNQGRFNKHCYTIVENMRQDLLKLIGEQKL
jgi:hypothetical protein